MTMAYPHNPPLPNCRPHCRFLIHCLSSHGGKTLTVALCVRCKKPKKVGHWRDSRFQLENGSVIEQYPIEKNLQYSSPDGVHNAQVAKDTCPRATHYTYDSPCIDCLRKETYAELAKIGADF